LLSSLEVIENSACSPPLIRKLSQIKMTIHAEKTMSSVRNELMSNRWLRSTESKGLLDDSKRRDYWRN
jgi:hypothetical protein